MRKTDNKGLQAWKRYLLHLGNQSKVLSARVRHINLFFAMVFSLLGAVVIAILAALVLAPRLNVGDQATPPADLTRLSLTIAAGVGGVVALVVAYRRQRDLEQGRFVEGFGAAAKQLGDSDVAVRLAGVYAMAGVADQTSKMKRQQCIDVLCGYLRLPYSPQLGNNHQSTLILKKPTHRKGSPEEEHRFDYRQNDKEVRQTIVRVIASHLQKTAEISWSSHDFDFTGSHLEEPDFTGAIFEGKNTSFSGASFSGKNTSFNEVTFSSESTSFFGATFSSGRTWFSEATFSSQRIWFNQATFSSAGTYFMMAKFSGRKTVFNGASFNGRASFIGVTFGSKESLFDQAIFSGEDTSFFGATFGSEDTSFHKANFISENTSFEQANFISGKISFEQANFGGGPVTFEHPRMWGATFTFDWEPGNEVDTLKPANVHPQNWPPAVVDSEFPTSSSGRAGELR